MDQKERLATILIAPLMTCSARLLVYTLIIGAFIPAQNIGPGIAVCRALYCLCHRIGIVGVGVGCSGDSAICYSKPQQQFPDRDAALSIAAAKRHVLCPWQSRVCFTVVSWNRLFLWRRSQYGRFVEFFPKCPQQQRKAKWNIHQGQQPCQMVLSQLSVRIGLIMILHLP